VEVRGSEGAVDLHMTHAEAERLAVALAEGYLNGSQAEYFIRTGLSEPGVRRVVEAIRGCVQESGGSHYVPLEVGEESLENPPRPRPSKD